jgi:hypothetical protein
MIKGQDQSGVCLAAPDRSGIPSRPVLGQRRGTRSDHTAEGDTDKRDCLGREMHGRDHNGARTLLGPSVMDTAVRPWQVGAAARPNRILAPVSGRPDVLAFLA